MKVMKVRVSDVLPWLVFVVCWLFDGGVFARKEEDWIRRRQAVAKYMYCGQGKSWIAQVWREDLVRLSVEDSVAKLFHSRLETIDLEENSASLRPYCSLRVV